MKGSYLHKSAMTFAVLGTLAACSEGLSPDDDPSLSTASAQRASAQSDVYFTAAVRGSGTVNIHGVVYTNDSNRGHSRQTVLAVPGFAETGATFGPLAKAMFNEPRIGTDVKYVIGLDMIGMGGSSLPANLPSGLSFGDLMIEDQASIVSQAIDALQAQRFDVRGIIGHSIGGLFVQTVQASLLAQGSSLAKHGVRTALLLAPVPPHSRPYTALNVDLSPFVAWGPATGAYLSIPAPVFQTLAFSTSTFTLAPNAPTIAQIVDNQYIGIAPLTMALQSFEVAGLVRPSVPAGAFAGKNGTELTMVAGSQDILVQASDLADLYPYLNGDTGKSRYQLLDGADAVHSVYISNPSQVVDALLH